MCFIILIIHTLANTTCKLSEDGVLTPKYVGVILIQIYTTYLYMLVYNKHLIINMQGINIKIMTQ